MVRILKKTSHGLTIAETVVAVSLLSMLLIAVLNLFPTALTAIGHTGERRQASLLAYDALSVIASRPFGNLALGVQDVSPLQVPTHLTLVVDVSVVDGYSPDFIKAVNSTVTWTARSQQHTVRHQVYVHPIRN